MKRVLTVSFFSCVRALVKKTLFFLVSSLNHFKLHIQQNKELHVRLYINVTIDRKILISLFLQSLELEWNDSARKQFKIFVVFNRMKIKSPSFFDLLYRDINFYDFYSNMFIYILNITHLQRRHDSVKKKNWTKSLTDFKTFDIWGGTMHVQENILFVHFRISNLWSFNASNIIRSNISHLKDFYRRFVKGGICARE